MYTHLMVIPVACITTLAAATLPDMTEYGSMEAWTRFGIAGLSLLAVIVLSTITGPRRERERDKSMADNIGAILLSSEEKMRIVMQGAEKANDKVCDRLDVLTAAVESGHREQQHLLQTTFIGLLERKEKT